MKSKRSNSAQRSSESIPSAYGSTSGREVPNISLLAIKSLKTSPGIHRAKDSIVHGSESFDGQSSTAMSVESRQASPRRRKTRKVSITSAPTENLILTAGPAAEGVNLRLGAAIQISKDDDNNSLSSDILPPVSAVKKTVKKTNTVQRSSDKRSKVDNKITLTGNSTPLPVCSEGGGFDTKMHVESGGRSKSRQSNWNLMSTEPMLIGSSTPYAKESDSKSKKSGKSKNDGKEQKSASSDKPEHSTTMELTTSQSSLSLSLSSSAEKLTPSVSRSDGRTRTPAVSSKTPTAATKSSSSVTSSVPLVEFAMTPQDSRVQFAGSVQMSSPTPNKQLAEMTTVTKASSISRGCQLAPVRLYQSDSSSGSSTHTTQRSTTAQTVSSGSFHSMPAVTESRGVGSGNRQQQQKPALPAGNTLTVNCVPVLAAQPAVSTLTLPVRFSTKAIGQNMFNVYSVGQAPQPQSFYAPVPAHSAHISPQLAGNGAWQQRIHDYDFVGQSNSYSKTMGPVSVAFGSSQERGYCQMILPQSVNYGMMYKSGLLSNTGTVYTQQQLAEHQRIQSQLCNAGNMLQHSITPQLHEPFTNSTVVCAQSALPVSQLIYSPVSMTSLTVNGNASEGTNVAEGSLTQCTQRDLTDSCYSLAAVTKSRTSVQKPVQLNSLQPAESMNHVVQVCDST